MFEHEQIEARPIYMQNLNFLEQYQSQTQRNYLERVCVHDKHQCAKIASQFGPEYWDGDRRFGYGGYRYDGRWEAVAGQLADHYHLRSGDSILDVGCGKGFLLFELLRLIDGLQVFGLDVSQYAIDSAKPEVKPYISRGCATQLPWADDHFDFVLSNGTLHNLSAPRAAKAIKEIERVGRAKKWVCVESFRNLDEKLNLLAWQLTCESFFDPAGWEWLFQQAGYTGDYGFIFFE